MKIRMINRRAACDKTSFSPTQLERLVRAKQFPQPVQLSPKRKAWIEDEITDWLQQKINAREATDVHQ